jgi:hypothetical protein
MDWRTSDERKRTQTDTHQNVDAGNARPGSLAVIAGVDLAATGPRLWLGPSLLDELQMARRSGRRFDAAADLSE